MNKFDGGVYDFSNKKKMVVFMICEVIRLQCLFINSFDCLINDVIYQNLRFNLTMLESNGTLQKIFV